jgi:hypothetical protein
MPGALAWPSVSGLAHVNREPKVRWKRGRRHNDSKKYYLSGKQYRTSYIVYYTACQP